MAHIHVHIHRTRDAWEESKHPRGQPGNAGEFVKQSTGSSKHPRTFYRGTNPGKTERISTGNEYWDKRLFISSDPEGAAAYGSHVDRYEADPDAKILYHGTKEFNSIAKGLPRNLNLLDYSTEVLKRAEKAGYDAVHFQRQSDVGTAVINPDKFKVVSAK